MVKDNTVAQYTEEARKGFTFRELNESVRKKALKDLRRTRKFELLGMFILLALGIIIANVSSNDIVCIFAYVFAIAVAFLFLVCIWQDTSNIRDLKKGKMYEFDVEVIKILPVEVSSHLAVGDGTTTERTYPIIGRDVISGYEDKCYIKENVYREAKCGDVITLRRKFLKKDLRKQNITIQKRL